MLEIGIVNLFLGIENFSPEVNRKSNKRAYGFGEVENLTGRLAESGMDVFLPLIIGMPGESEEILKYNAECLDRILGTHARKQYGQGGIVRVDLSGGLPLRGTVWYHNLSRNLDVQKDYHQRVGIPLNEHIDPDYPILRQLSARYHEGQGISAERLDQHKKMLGDICLRHLKPEQIGGIDFQPTK